MGFEKEQLARAFLTDVQERFAKFGLALHPDKTRLIQFGRFASDRRRRDGEGRPETFDFLGFTPPILTYYGHQDPQHIRALLNVTVPTAKLKYSHTRCEMISSGNR